MASAYNTDVDVIRHGDSLIWQADGIDEKRRSLHATYRSDHLHYREEGLIDGDVGGLAQSPASCKEDHAQAKEVFTANTDIIHKQRHARKERRKREIMNLPRNPISIC